MVTTTEPGTFTGEVSTVRLVSDVIVGVNAYVPNLTLGLQKLAYLNPLPVNVTWALSFIGPSHGETLAMTGWS